MCYTKEASITAFTVGVISSILLIFFGNQEFKKENVFVGIVFIYVAFMQLVDYMIYIDPTCSKGWNKLSGYIGPLLNASQPTLMFLFFMFFSNDPSNKFHKYRSLAIVLNFLYIGYIITIYSMYIKNGDICSYNKEGRPSWVWYENGFGRLFYLFYLLMFIINIVLIIGSLGNDNTNEPNSSRTSYIVIALILIFLYFILSKINYKYQVGEFWCYFVNSVPLFILVFQKMNLF